ncbi:hypothetical protein BGW80DRAFT_1294488, partial [Lactifluus volemus]
MCRPDIIAAFDRDWQGDIAWPCVRLVGKKASTRESLKDQAKHTNSYLYFLLLARPDLYIAQGLFISNSEILFLLGTIIICVHLSPLQPSYTFNITPSQGSAAMICPGFNHVYAGNPFSTRTHVFSNPTSRVSVKDKALVVIKEQICEVGRRSDELEILDKVHQPVSVPGVVQGVYSEVVTTPQSVKENRGCKHRLGLSESGLPFTSIPTPQEMLEILFDLLEVLRCLYSNCRVLHRDISSGNVLYVKNASSRVSLNVSAAANGFPLYFAKRLLGKSDKPQETSLLLVDFNLAEHLGSKTGSERIGRTVSCISILIHTLAHSHFHQGTPIFIARAV